MHMLDPAELPWLSSRFGTHRGLVRSLLAEVEYHSHRLTSFVSIRWEDVARVVFVCQGNICRSAYAHELARMKGLSSMSCGLSTSTGKPADSTAQKIASERGVNLDKHRTTDLSDFSVSTGDLLLGMEIRQARALAKHSFDVPMQIGLLGLYANPRRIHLHDPFSLSESYFRTCFSLIETAIENIAVLMKSSRTSEQ